jgi:lipopolysaccharide/colanic/teichoic acid biosynthesis glycosyltransferase
MIRLFKVSIPSSSVVLVISDAILLFSCYLFAAWLAIDVPLVKFLFEESGYWHIAFVMAVIMLGLYFNDLYEHYQVRSRIELIQQFCLALGIAFLLQSLVSYAQWGVLLPKWVMVYGSLLALVVLPLWRMFFTALASSSIGAQKLLFVGSSPAVREITAYLKEHPEFGLSSIGYLDSSDEIPGMTKLGSIAQLEEVLAEQQPSRVVIGLDLVAPQSLPVGRLLELRLAGLDIEEASSTYEMVFRRVSSRDLPLSQLIFSNEMSPRGASVTLQSAYSLLLALFALVAMLPVMALIALIVKLTSGGPVMERERCAGLNGVQFTLLKFRSTGSRSTGKWMRRLRLDQLPQLFNVVRGDLAIVGPRPERPEFAAVLEEKIPYYRQRLCVKPGITGWAQINEKEGSDAEDTIQKLGFDRYYIKNLSLALDTYIIFHALKTTLLGR